MSKKTELYWLLLALAALLQVRALPEPDYGKHITSSDDCKEGLHCDLNQQNCIKCICINQTSATNLVHCQSQNETNWSCSIKDNKFVLKSIGLQGLHSSTQDCYNTSTCNYSLPLRSNLPPAAQYMLVVKVLDVYNRSPPKCIIANKFIVPPQFLTVFSQREGPPPLRWRHRGHVGNISAGLMGVDLSNQSIQHNMSCTVQPDDKTEDNVTCTWTALTALVNYTRVSVRWLPVNSATYQPAYNFSLLSSIMLIPDVLKNASYSNITSVSVHLSLWETKQQKIAVGFYLIKSSNNEKFDCGVLQIGDPCKENEKLKNCKTYDKTLTAPVRSTSYDRSDITRTASTIVLDNLWPSTEYKFTVTPVFCNGSNSVDGVEYHVGPVNTSKAEIKSVTFTSKHHDNLTVQWTTADPHPHVSYTVYVTDALDFSIHNTCTNIKADTSYEKRILCSCNLGDNKGKEYSCKGSVRWPFWEYRITINASSVRANFSYQGVVHTEPWPPNKVKSPSVTTANNALKCGDQRFTNYSFVCVTWYDRCPRKRHGFIKQYLVNVTASVWSNNETFSSSFFNITNMTEYRLSPAQNYSTLVRVQPGDWNNITISALTDDWVEGASELLPVNVSVPKPALALNRSQVEEMVKKEDVNKTMTSLQFALPNTTFMFSDSKGFTLKPPIFIVTRSNEMLPENDTGVKTFDKYPSWHEINNTSSLAAGYRVHLDVADSNTSTQLEIGSNKTCANSSDTGSYCNGPLEPGKIYSVSSALCNEMVCVFVTLVKDVSTLPQDKEDSLWMKLLVGIGAVVAALLVILIVCLCCCCQRRQKKKLKVSEWTQMKNVKGPRATRPMKLATLEDAIATKERDDGLVLRDEYCDLTLCTKDKLPHAACDSELNRSKNRWADIVAYDHSRVTLSLDEEGSDYINANFIPGYSREKEYIATQGPLPFTTNDFWKMVWEYQLSVIVMLTLPKEEGKIKCEHYWPAQINEMVEYGNIRVTTVSISNVNDYNITIFTLQHVKEKGKELQVSHFQYLKWPDMTADVTAESMVEFITLVRQQVKPKSPSPVVVHCSAGVGRSGTFICLDYALQFINEQPVTAELDLFRFILRMRQARILMVQTESQYILIHQCARYMMAQRRRREAERISSNSIASRMLTLDGATDIDQAMSLDEPANHDTEELDTSQLSHAESSDQSIERRPVFRNHREKSYERWHLGGRNLPPQLHVPPTVSSEDLSSP